MGYSATDRPEPERRRGGSGGGDEDAVQAPEKPVRSGEAPDVDLNVPVLKVDEISLKVENLEAHVALVAQVLDLLKLSVGADVGLGKVELDIKGVEAEAHLKVRLDNVAVIVNRVLTTLDRNPEILQYVGRGLESAVRDIGGGAGSAVGELGRGTGSAVEDVGRGAGSAVESVGEGAGSAVEDVGRGAGSAVEDVGRGAGSAVEDVGQGAGRAVEDIGEGAGSAVEDVGEGTAGAVGDIGSGVGGAAREVGKGAGVAAGDVKNTAEEATRAAEDLGDRPGPRRRGGAPRRRPRGEHAGNPVTRRRREPETDDPDDDGDDREHDPDEEEVTALQNALHEAEDSVRDLGRTLLKMVSGGHPGRSSGGRDE
jgi:hypothetical protein